MSPTVFAPLPTPIGPFLLAKIHERELPMAKKSRTSKRRQRRTPDQIIADLQEEIRRVRARQKAKELKGSPAHKAAIAAIKAMDKALAEAANEGATSLRHALADGRKSLGAYLESQGMVLPKANLPKGPRPKTQA